MKILKRKQFLQLVKQEPHRWYHYCEIVITRGGRIILAIPSHQQCLLNYFYKKERVDSEWYKRNISTRLSPNDFVIDKYGLISVWYDFIVYSKEKGISKAQMETLNMLKDNNLISADCIKYPTFEYIHHLIDIGERTYDDLYKLADVPYDRMLFKKE